MARQNIELGTPPSGVGGDTPRSANVKINANFSELYLKADQLSAVNDSLSATFSELYLKTDKLSAANDSLSATVMRRNVGNSSAGTSLSSGGPPAIGSINKTGNERNTALTISNDSNHGASAVMSFIREGAFGCHFGLDVNNELRVGGWSFGDVSYKIYHEGNTTRAADGTLKAI